MGLNITAFGQVAYYHNDYHNDDAALCLIKIFSD